MFKETTNRVRSMALVHEELYRSKDLAMVNFKEYIKSLTSKLIRVYALRPLKVRMKIEVTNISLGIDWAVPCGLVINELVSNALKHVL